MKCIEDFLVNLLRSKGYIVQRFTEALPGIPDRPMYKPFVNTSSIYSPWDHDETIEGIAARLRDKGRTTLVSRDRMWILLNLATQAMNLEGELWEAGVYQGGTARLLHEVLKRHEREKHLRLFDTFEGMPETDKSIDAHNKGDYADTDLEAVKDFVGRADCIDYRMGFVPDTFAGLEDSRVALAHIDLDIYRSILDACAFIYPRMTTGGFMLFDDYGFHTCVGARRAVDEFFVDKPETPVPLPTSQCVVVKL